MNWCCSDNSIEAVKNVKVEAGNISNQNNVISLEEGEDFVNNEVINDSILQVQNISKFGVFASSAQGTNDYIVIENELIKAFSINNEINMIMYFTNLPSKNIDNMINYNFKKDIIIFSSGPTLNEIKNYLHIFTPEFYREVQQFEQLKSLDRIPEHGRVEYIFNKFDCLF